MNTFHIYSITNIVNGRKYIGCTFNFKRRFYNHTRSLKGNQHYSKDLQDDFNCYGIDSFKFEVISSNTYINDVKMTCAEKKLIKNERNPYNKKWSGNKIKKESRLMSNLNPKDNATDYLIYIIKKKSKTLSEVSLQMGYSHPSGLHNILKHPRRLSVEQVIKLSEILKLKPHVLLTRIASSL